MVPCDTTTHPWVYLEDDTPRCDIAVLELLGDVYLTAYSAGRYPGAAGTRTATASTDTYGSTYIIREHYTGAFPNTCITMELTDRFMKADLYLRVDHKERSGNAWADALVAQNCRGLDPK